MTKCVVTQSKRQFKQDPYKILFIKDKRLY